ncbi:hypothetical protein PVAP13_2KG271760 [Panicum virgatum]|uniref:Uncharacterized protein n=1 Tax=Panicum virgatum TaxID=38727 RepID=A0A8T0W2B7_PANVG|nr:hypothetical protein PVAP13_2KG271760 [Panicum virgatum]
MRDIHIILITTRIVARSAAPSSKCGKKEKKYVSLILFVLHALSPRCAQCRPGTTAVANPRRGAAALLAFSRRPSAVPRLVARAPPPRSPSPPLLVNLRHAPPPHPGEAAAIPLRCPASSTGRHRRRRPRCQCRLPNPPLARLLLHATAHIHHLHAEIHQGGGQRRPGWSGRGKGAGASADDGAGGRSRPNPPLGCLWSDPTPAAGRSRRWGSRGGEPGRRAVTDRRRGRRARGRGRRPAAGEEGEGHGAAVRHAWLTFRSLANTCPRIPVC